LRHHLLRVIEDKGIKGSLIAFEPAQRRAHDLDRRDFPVW
jgi:hypothetical protein